MATTSDGDDIGTFDEESCRYFLREVGERVVPAYPFGYGMEEAYSLILEKYGYSGTSDALSLLRELLEDDDVAAGAGDDGDIWRAWRHQWARRNCDPLNPYIPRIGTFVLPCPTPKHIRNLKAEAFLRRKAAQSQQNVAEEADTKLSPEASISDSAVAMQSTNNSPNKDLFIPSLKPSYSHQRCRLGLSHFHDRRRHSLAVGYSNDYPPRTTTHSQQNISHSKSSPNLDGHESPQLVPFEMVACPPVHPGQHTHGQGRLAKIQALPQNSFSLARLSTQHDLGPKKHKHSASLSQSDCTWASNRKSHRSRLSCSGEGLGQEDFNVLPNKHVSEKRLSASSNLQRCFNTAQSLESCITPEPQRKTVHRNTSLIDGIFNSSASRTDHHGDCPTGRDGRGSKRHSKLLDWVPGQSKTNRKSWLQGVKSMLGAARESPSSTVDVLTRTDPMVAIGADQSNVQECSSTQMSNLAESPFSKPFVNPGFFLDGACDEHMSQSSTGSYLNKPLPLTPKEIVKSLSSRPRRDSHAHTTICTQASPQDSIVSTLNTPTKGVMGRDDRRFEPMRAAEPCFHETDRRYQRHVMRPPDQSSLSEATEQDISPLSFTSIAQQNPFTQNIPSHTPTRHSAAMSSKASLPASQSEPNLSYRNSRPPPPIPVFYNDQGVPETPLSCSPEPSTKEDVFRDQPPVKPGSDSLQDTHSLKAAGSRKSTPNRSRSPMKRMLGFGKIKTPDRRTEKQATPNSSSKRSLKLWTNKIRHGFLTADEEEVQREEQIEIYMESSSIPVPEQPATFPISLDPAHQARLLADMELMIVVSANRFLLKEAEVGRLSPATVAATRDAWEKRNLPQVLEYLYDQSTQYQLIMANFQSLNFYGSGNPDPVELNSTIYSWGVLAREMSVRTFCAGDSVIRKWLNDARRVLEMLGAPLITFLAFQDLEVKTLACISRKQHRRLQGEENVNAAEPTGSVPRRDWSATSNYGLNHRRNMSEGSYKYSALPPGLEYLNLSPTPAPTPTPRRAKSVKSRTPSAFTTMPLPNSYSAHQMGHAGDNYGSPHAGLRQDVHQQSHIPTTPRRQIQTGARRFQGVERGIIPMRREI